MRPTPRALVVLGFGVLFAWEPAVAQPPGKVARIGILCAGDCPAAPFETGYLAQSVTALRDHGYIDGGNVVLDPRGILRADEFIQ